MNGASDAGSFDDPDLPVSALYQIGRAPASRPRNGIVQLNTDKAQPGHRWMKLREIENCCKRHLQRHHAATGRADSERFLNHGAMVDVCRERSIVPAPHRFAAARHEQGPFHSLR